MAQRLDAFLGFQKRQPRMVLVEDELQLGFGEDHAGGRERVRFGSSIGKYPGAILAKRGLSGPRIEYMASLHCQP